MKCSLCLIKEGTEPICKLCLSGKITDKIRLEQPEYYKESVMDLFKEVIKPELDEILNELERVKTELRIKKVKRRKS